VAKKAPPPADVFRYEARHEGRTGVVHHGVEAPGGGLDVETEAYPVGHKPEEPPVRRTFSFTTYEKARRFTDDVLTALEYQNCLVNEHS
jgi:hypothetical protein